MGDSKGQKHRDGRQVAALPLGRDDAGRVQVMLVTSRGTGRWVLPKGWPMKGKKPYRAAEREAFEEAGLEGRVRKVPVGTYSYDKLLDTGIVIPCEVTVFPLEVEHRRDNWPEMTQRQRRWFSLDEAASAVAEAGLREILQGIARQVR
ncbi:MAG TPA: NUDIX hydrolase [Microvirga sp.]|jgi:8-oxo-dGTP pyrophosphatase MutT (NUDIX family)|nr:NUDIX hydrolase [Microvirga sp.]